MTFPIPERDPTVTPHPDLTALVAGIRHDRRNHLRRLVSADWFDENGQPERAEFIRLTVAAADELRHCRRQPSDIPPRAGCDCEACVSAGRLRDLTDVFLSVWEHDLCQPAVLRYLDQQKVFPAPPEGYLHPQFRWSLDYVVAVRCRLDWWVEWGPFVSQFHPARRVRISDQTPQAVADPPESDAAPRYFWDTMPHTTPPTRYFPGVLPAMFFHSRHVCRFELGDPSAVPPMPARIASQQWRTPTAARGALSRSCTEWAELAVGVTPDPVEGAD